MSDGEIPARNTGVQLWNERGDHSSVFLSENGGIGLSHAGHVCVRTTEEWIRLARAADEIELDLKVILLMVEDEAYKVADGQQPCKHTAALNEVRELVAAALARIKRPEP